jgi:hypothetical protein
MIHFASNDPSLYNKPGNFSDQLLSVSRHALALEDQINNPELGLYPVLSNATPFCRTAEPNNTSAPGNTGIELWASYI